MADQSHNGQPRKPDSGEKDEPASGKPPEFERFEGLTRKLMKVPKRELDEKVKQAKL